MNTLGVKISLTVNNLIFAILLNSVGVVILQMINVAGIAPEQASVLEAFKDLPIAAASFLLASFIPRFGYRRAMLTGLAIVSVASCVMALGGGFSHAKVLFFLTGISFALIKISGYSTIGLITRSAGEHASFMSIMEGFFMVGVLSGFWLFGWFIDLDNAGSGVAWTSVYWLLAGLALVAFGLLLATPIDETGAVAEDSSPGRDFLDMIALMRLPLVIFFALGIFTYVYVEQALNTWLPSFNNRVLLIPDAMSVQLGSVYAGSLALGRIVGGWVMKRVDWYYVLQACLLTAAALVVAVLPLAGAAEPGAVQGWGDVPLAAWLFPAIGLFLAPMYPTLSSTVLSALPANRQSGMTGLLVIFSALGGTTGSIITGFVFGRLDGQVAFYLTLVPLALIMLTLIPYRARHRRRTLALQQTDAHADAGL